jgi:uncharacterized protein DUF3108
MTLIAKRIGHVIRDGALARVASIVLVLLAAAGVHAAPAWRATLTKDPPGNFASLRPLHASYIFGWSGFTAATAEIQFSTPAPDRCQLQATGHTIGLARTLWRYDVNYRALANSSTMRPIEAEQVDIYRAKKMTTNLTFTESGVRRLRTEVPPHGPTKPKNFSFPDLYDFQTAGLYLRSQPLQSGSSYRLVIYPATNAYVAIATVIGREKVPVRAGSYNAIKVDLQLKRVGKDMQLEPHRKFRRATIWISDDPDRMILRAEAQVFVGTVFAELQSVRFDADQG